ncbi:hypothetical protein [Nocardia farcinica]|uniref:hypothetical protein n=1 Tax=Nocardia farcinica TaxID=37329 RepID=UPI001895A79D|nr:hypothetical protein [Nocardia farcinica]MBF6271031.1 hypothetical protein [Nocardia farcinica]MCZ9330187.1 hypothetical protein [Nocardia farcinica]UAK33318.1 hypothetical protein K8O92_04845 [Nocardia asteroides]
MTPRRGGWTKCRAFTTLAALSALTLAACSSGGGDPGAARESGLTSTSANSTQIAVNENEFSINISNPPSTAGAYTFVVENSGSVSHDLVIEGPGVESRRTPRIEKGGSGELAVDLEPGTYTLWCSVGNHRELGMSTEITVS